MQPLAHPPRDMPPQPACCIDWPMLKKSAKLSASTVMPLQLRAAALFGSTPKKATISSKTVAKFDTRRVAHSPRETNQLRRSQPIQPVRQMRSQQNNRERFVRQVPKRYSLWLRSHNDYTKPVRATWRIDISVDFAPNRSMEPRIGRQNKSVSQNSRQSPEATFDAVFFASTKIDKQYFLEYPPANSLHRKYQKPR